MKKPFTNYHLMNIEDKVLWMTNFYEWFENETGKGFS